MLGPREGEIQAPDEFVDSEHPRLYRPITYTHYRSLAISTKLRIGEAISTLRIHHS